MKVIISLGCSVVNQMNNNGFPDVRMQAILIDKFDVFSKISVGDKLNWVEIWDQLGLLKSVEKADKHTLATITDYFVCDKTWSNLITNPTLNLCVEGDEGCPTIGFFLNSSLAKKIDAVLGAKTSEHIEQLLENKWLREEMPKIGDRVDLWSMFPELFLDGVGHEWSTAQSKQSLRAIFKDNIVQVVSRSFHWANHVELTLGIVEKP